MELFTHDSLRELTARQTGPCVSLFQPTHRSGPDIRQDPIRLSNLLSQIREELTAGGMRTVEARNLLAPAQALVEDGDFWRYQRGGLAMFIAPGLFHLYRVPHSLEESTVMADSFQVKPLLPLLTGDGRFFLLVLDQERSRFFDGTRSGMTEVVLPGVPMSLSEALRYEERERQLQFHTRTAPAAGGERQAMYHGHGVGKDDSRSDLLRFFQRVAKGVKRALHDETAPLITAGAEHLHAIYREANDYGHLLGEGIRIDESGLSDRELHDRAWLIAAPLFRRAQQTHEERYRELAGTGLASGVITEVLSAAYYGKIEALFTALGLEAWGRFDPARNAVTIHQARQDGDEELLNSAAVQTLLHQGAVYAVPPEQVPGGGVVAAVFRY